jgi:hypothetical protein
LKFYTEETLNHYKETINRLLDTIIIGIIVWLIVIVIFAVKLRDTQRELDSIRSQIETIESTKKETEEKSKSIESRISAYLNAKKSIGSADIAAACVEAGADPFLLAAIATRESNGNPWAPRGKAGEQGAWQVRAKYWGHVPSDVFGQAAQAERVIRELIATHGSLRAALIRYNGQGKAAVRYADSVLRIYGEIKG